MDFGVKANLLEKSGSWYAFQGQKVGQGREAARQFLKENPDIAQAIERAIRQNSTELLTETEGTTSASTPEEEAA